MSKQLNQLISALPIRIEDLKVDPALLRLRELHITQYGHLPGRTLRSKCMTYTNWSFTYIVRGQGFFQIDDGPVHRLEAGSLFWEWPGSTFRYGPEKNSAWDEYYVVFNGTRVQEWIKNQLIRLDEVYRVGVNNTWIRKLETIGDYIESGIPENADRAAMMLETLIYDFFIANKEGKPGRTLSRKPESILNLLEYISNNLYQPWNEQKMLDTLHLSRSTLRRIVQQNTGYSLNEYVNRLKISEAKKLLRLTDMKVKEIAQMLGYDDHSYFSRLFKKYEGSSANQYRQLQA